MFHATVLIFCSLLLSYFLTLPSVARLSYLSLANVEVLVAVVDDGTVLAVGSDVANTLREGKHEKTISRQQIGCALLRKHSIPQFCVPLWLQQVPQPSLLTHHHWDRKWWRWEGP